MADAIVEADPPADSRADSEAETGAGAGADRGAAAVAAEPEAAPEAEPEAAPEAEAEAEAGASGGVVPEPEPASEPEPSAAPAAPSFVAEAKRRAFWSSRPMRALLWSAFFLLALGLALQAALSRRDWLAARAPALAAPLGALCAVVGCEIRPHRQLEAIVIDGSAFQRASADGFRFSVSLRNTADLPVATPSLELSLTDVADQVLLRRVIAPAELGAPAALAARGEFNASQRLTVADSASPSAIVGYRLVAFYP